ncbi:MAG: NUDIX domain-containing protein [Undibacterium sp.]|nr:NUDIX domain-containing protein [Undibacterium sp.]
MSNAKQSEKEFLRTYNIHDYEVPLTSVDLAIFTIKDQLLQVLLVKRGDHPFKGKWCLPGGFIDIHHDADLDAAALRTLREKTGVDAPYLEQLQGFGSGVRDPRGWSTTFVYFALISSDQIDLIHGGNADAVRWCAIDDQNVIPPLAFDHKPILEVALQRLRNKVEYTSLPAHLLPEEFTLTELQQVYQIVLGRLVDKSAFRKRIREGDFLEELEGKWRYGSNRPAQLHRLRKGQDTVYFSRLMSGETSAK